MVDTENPAPVPRMGKAKGHHVKKAPLASRQQTAVNSPHRSIEQRYQKKTQLEHILLRPDTYIGSTEKITQEMWVYNEPTNSIVKRMVTFVPGLYKIFDEIIVNAADNKQRDTNMSNLKVEIDPENGTISVWNDGRGIPIQMHREHNCYVPELIFGHLLTGSNFDDQQRKTTGGRNGFGAKLANIYSTEFIVETADGRSGKHYKQVFRNNMQEKDEPIITEDYDGTDFTCISFTPDWGRFHMIGMEADTIALLRKRVHDMAGCMAGYGGARMKVTLDKKRLQVSTFKEYVSMYEGMEDPVFFEKIGGRWEVGVALSPDNIFQQISYVNAICTIKGGTHVECIANQVVNRLLPVLKRKHKSEVKGHFVKNHICVFVNGLVENPAFNSQSKEILTSKETAFGSIPTLSEASLKAVEKSEIVDRVLSWAKHRQDQQLNKKSGKKSGKLTGISKLDDANNAGTSKSQDCTLILTEGDSAKTLAVSGLGVVGRDRYGVFPLKGKLLNVREASNPQVLKNEEIQNLVKIMGLKFNHVYTDTKSLRYGHLMIMTDQDHDGSHIKGLLINFVHHYWPSLLKIDGFLQEFITPIVKAFKGRQQKWFYTIPEYAAWMESTDGGRGWTGKYYKGLGTSSPNEAKEYFAALDTHQLEFEWKDDDQDSNLIDMAFNKKRAEDRKDWLRGFKAGTHADYDVESVTYESFINKELILFSMEDNKRSIPCLVDGFKPSQRKVLFSCFKRNLKKEIKVGQLAGYVSEHSAYHHGEASLNGTIIAMAQNFTGSNNINLLTPGGQFGTRLMGGKDAASPRYIFTCLEKVARTLFHPHDDPLLHYLEDDGLSIEPEFYIPIIPLILVNGSDGIGTGWSSQVPNYSPRDVMENIKRRIRGEGFVELQPWYNGFAGSITAKPGVKKAGEAGYICRGIVERINQTTVEITELPVRRWTQDYKQFLESLLPGAEDAKAKAPGKGPGAKKASAAAKSQGHGDGNGDGDKAKDRAFTRHIKDFKENHTDTSVHFTVVMAEEDLDAIEAGDGLHKYFKLESSLSTSNMVLFDQDGQLIKYESPQHIVEDFYKLRMEYYHRRKQSLLDKLQKEWSKLDNKVRFILAVVEERLQINNRKKADLLAELKREGYDMFLPTNTKVKVAGAGGNTDEDGDGNESSASDDLGNDDLSKGYDYLLSMKIWSLTLERVRMLENELEAKTEEMAALKATSPSQLWLNDLGALEVVMDEIAEAVKKQEQEDEKQRKIASKRKGGGRAKGRGGGGRGGKAHDIADDDDDSDFEFGARAKKKSSKAQNVAAPPPLPTRAVVPPLVSSHSGGKVTAAFAQAEAGGKIVTEDALEKKNIVPHNQDERAAVKGVGNVSPDHDDDEEDEMGEKREKKVALAPDLTANGARTKTAPASKVTSTSLSARLKQKFGDTSEKAQLQRPPPRKPPVVHEVVLDSDTDGAISEEEARTRQVAPRDAAPRVRPGRSAAMKKKPVVDLASDDDGDDDDYGESEHLEDKASAAEDEDEDEDEYEPTPAKPKARGGKSKGRQAPAKSAAVTGAKGKERDSRMDNGANDGAKDGESAAFAMDDTDEEFCVTAKGRAVAAARTTAATAKTKSTAAPRGKGKASSKATKVTKVTKATKATKKPQGVKRGSRQSVSDDDGPVFSPDKMSPPTKRLSQKATPLASRFQRSKLPEKDEHDDESDESGGSSQAGKVQEQEVTKTPRPRRRGAGSQKVTYVELDSDDDKSDSDDDDDEADAHFDNDDDDEYEFDG